jgi:hypothetical protein
MEPVYFKENRYSFVLDALPVVYRVDYEVDTPETSFERQIQRRLATANRLLMDGRFGSALGAYRELRGLVSSLINPIITYPAVALADWSTLRHDKMLDTVVARAADMLKETPVPGTSLPSVFRSGEIKLPDAAAAPFVALKSVGLTDKEGGLGPLLTEAERLVGLGQFAEAAKTFETAVDAASTLEIRAAIMHDLAIVRERAGDRDAALETMQASSALFGRGRRFEDKAMALDALAALHSRSGDADKAKESRAAAEKLRRDKNIFSVTLSQPTAVRIVPGVEVSPTIQPRPSPDLPPLVRPNLPRLEVESTPVAESEAMLIAYDRFVDRRTQKQLTIAGADLSTHAIKLDGNASANLASFYENLTVTSDLGLLMGYLDSYTQTIAYLPHVYFWVIPMAIGDCLVGLGDFEAAEKEYLSTLNYRYLNVVVEAVTVWLRLANLYNDWGDRLYRQARNDASMYGPAKAKYENLLTLNNSIKTTSPLYKSAKFGPLRGRAKAIIEARFVNRTSIDENPRLILALMHARIQLTKIASGLNYLGISTQVPPFAFEYLQNVARYFAQHASQVEQTYIQFQSTAENEKLREQQMSQQVDVAEASVELEERGRDEAEAGLDVAQASQNYANVQAQNAQQAANDFAAVRWELLELSALQAWSSAAAVDEDDEVQQTIRGFNYYNTSGKDRSDVLYDLAVQRTRISHDLEANRLQREIASAQAYAQVAQQQAQQAEARVAIAEQRVAIAEMQAQHARENQAFLTGREFSSAMWYDLAREARRLAQRYLDMAVEVAVLMEIAYKAETGRDLRKIKFEYGLNHLNGMLGAEALLLDIDHFSLDFVRAKSKRAPLKQVISLADHFPIAFEQLLSKGTAYFETTLEHFDRRYPGFYLQKVKQVELMFVGLGGTEGAHGTLRNIGLSSFRRKDGTIVSQTYPADVMPLSDYNVRNDALIFQLDDRELRLFENNGVATMWQLELPVATNVFDLRQILDIQLVVYYDGYFDEGLKQQILAALPSKGTASRGLSLRMMAPDEWFYLRANGTASLALTPDLFPANHTEQKLKSFTLQARGTAVGGLKLRVELDKLGASHTFQLDAEGLADGAAFPSPLNKSLFDSWTFTVDPEDNPGFDLTGIDDLSLFIEYAFDYRT